MKYYYVVLASEWDLYKTSYSDLDNCKNAEYIAGLPSLYGNRVAKFLNSSIIRINRIPFGWLLLMPLFKRLKKVNQPICFIFFGNWVEYEFTLHFMDKAKKLFPDSKYVWFMQDLIDTHARVKTSMPNFKKKFDLTMSFDYKDCETYDMVYHPLVFSSISLSVPKQPTSDIYFLGKVKNRMPEILRAFEYFKEMGLKTDFYLVDVPLDMQQYKNEIHYINGMSYLDNLKHVCESKCVLEIMQKGGTGYTQRVNEILYFNKKLITNNNFLLKAPFYDVNNMLVIDDSFALDKDFVKRIKTDEPVNYNYKDKLSPIKFLEFIESEIS